MTTIAEPLTLPTVAAIDAERKRRASRQTLLKFTQATLPSYETNWHHAVVSRYLDRVLAGTTRRLIICLPPQNGKSELVSRRFPAYALGCQPDLRIIACSYSASLANDMSRDVQKILSTEEYRELFPGTRLATAGDLEVRQASAFEIVGRRGSYRGAGVGGGIVGKSADIAIIDDPVKNRQEAESEVYRKAVWNWYTSALTSRLFGDTGRIVIALTRWHADDLAGRLLRLQEDNPHADRWTVLSFPAIAEADDQPADPRKIGEPLWPSRYPLAELESRKAGIGSYDWSALYQQRPSPAGGGLFKREWFPIVDALPVGPLVRCRAWDCAATAGGGDYTVGAKLALDLQTKRLYVEHVIRGQWSAGQVDTLIQQTAKTDGPSVRIREEQEGGSAGKAVIAARLKALMGYAYRGVPSTGDKETRARPFAVQAEAGNVALLRGAWNQDWLDEACVFPFGMHDDQVDASSSAFTELAFGAGTVSGMPVAVPKDEGMWTVTLGNGDASMPAHLGGFGN